MGEKVKVIEVHESIFSANTKTADETRRLLKENGTFMVNVMSSPGSGKTTLLSSLINMMKNDLRIGEMDVDIDSSVDAQKVQDKTGIRTMQIHNGGLCHIDAGMTSSAIKEYGIDGLDLLILENIGNLVCPAEFDTGAHENIMLLSVPEGDDKPLKYPLMFSICSLVIITKIDTISYFDFDFAKAEERIRELNPFAKVIRVSAKTGEGMEQLVEYFKTKVKKLKYSHL